MAFAILLLLIKWKGMKKFIPVGLFASFYANIWCFIAMNLKWWDFPERIIDKPDDVSLAANFIVVPVMAMFWVRYAPLTFREKIMWAFAATSILTGFEFILERHTQVLKYSSGYDWYFSYVLWFVSWFIWYGFHIWLNNWRRDVESIFK